MINQDLHTFIHAFSNLEPFLQLRALDFNRLRTQMMALPPKCREKIVMITKENLSTVS